MSCVAGQLMPVSVPVVAQEDVLEVVLAGPDRLHLVAAAALTTASAEPSKPTVSVRAVGVDVGDARQRRNSPAVDRRGELDLEPLDGDLAEVLQRVDDDEPPLAQDREPVGDPLDLRQRVRGEEHRATLGADLAEQRVEALLHERIEAGDRLVKDQQLGLVHERLDQAELLAVAGRELAGSGGRGRRRSARASESRTRGSTPPRSSAR